jgi:hypothetical protein
VVTWDEAIPDPSCPPFTVYTSTYRFEYFFGRVVLGYVTVPLLIDPEESDVRSPSTTGDPVVYIPIPHVVLGVRPVALTTRVQEPPSNATPGLPTVTVGRGPHPASIAAQISAMRTTTSGRRRRQ